MKRIILWILVSLVLSGVGMAQFASIDFLDPRMAVDPDALAEAMVWDHDSIFLDSMPLERPNQIFRRRIRIQSILNTGHKTGDDRLNYRYRFLLQTQECDFAYLRQPNYQTGGIKIEPLRNFFLIIQV